LTNNRRAKKINKDNTINDFFVSGKQQATSKAKELDSLRVYKHFGSIALGALSTFDLEGDNLKED
jgi:hypothetical protein